MGNERAVFEPLPTPKGRKFSGSDNKTTTKTTTKTTNEDLIIAMIRNNPQISAEEMAEELELSVNGIRYYIKKLKKEGVLVRVRVGSTKKGHWEINM